MFNVVYVGRVVGVIFHKKCECVIQNITARKKDFYNHTITVISHKFPSRVGRCPPGFFVYYFFEPTKTSQ